MTIRYSRQISTGSFLESQSGGSTDEHLQTLKTNAINAGIAENDIEVGYADDAVFWGWLKEQVEAERTYAEKRKAEYPSISDQLDYIFHNGIEKWKADMILPVKEKYPKGAN